MKTLLAALVAVSAHFVSAHYTLPDLIANGTTFADWLYVRETANHYSNGPVTNVTDEAIRCYELDYTTTAPATSIATVAAGSTVGFKANDDFYHPGVGRHHGSQHALGD